MIVLFIFKHVCLCHMSTRWSQTPLNIGQLAISTIPLMGFGLPVGQNMRQEPRHLFSSSLTIPVWRPTIFVGFERGISTLRSFPLRELKIESCVADFRRSGAPGRRYCAGRSTLVGRFPRVCLEMLCEALEWPVSTLWCFQRYWRHHLLEAMAAPVCTVQQVASSWKGKCGWDSGHVETKSPHPERAHHGELLKILLVVCRDLFLTPWTEAYILSADKSRKPFSCSGVH